LDAVAGSSGASVVKDPATDTSVLELGTTVAVAFLDGNPDFPIVLGVVSFDRR
jgi:hypothetical protein